MTFCTRCGTTNDPQARFCGGCGGPLSSSQPVGGQTSSSGAAAAAQPAAYTPSLQSAPGYGAPPSYSMPAQAAAPGYAVPGALRYAGFWRRFLAVLIDGLILGVAMAIPVVLFTLLFSAAAPAAGDVSGAEGMILSLAGVGFMILMLIWIVVPWLYEAAMISSARQATWGKRALGIIVTDSSGNRITFGRATGRYFAKMISGFILYVGFIMAAFTARKQALHDMIADCVVMVRE